MTIGRDVAVGVLTAVVLGIGGFIANTAVDGGLVRVLGGVTRSTLHDELTRIAKDPQYAELNEMLRGKEGPPGKDAIAPAGIVVASLVACAEIPKDPQGRGWTLYADASGRFIVGAGPHSNTYQPLRTDANGNEVRAEPRPLPPPLVPFTTGGEPRHWLTIDEMPQHNHFGWTSDIPSPIGYIFARDVNQRGTNDGTVDANAGNVAKGDGFSQAYLFEQGRSQPHNNMPPYLALFFCKKD